MKYHLIALSFFLFGSLMAQEAAPAISFTDLEGKSIELQEYQGEVLYVSFWASWCKPCISNFKKYAPMREKMQEAGVVLLNVNIDKEHDKWTTSLSDNPINGVNVRGQNLDVLQELYGLYSIPTYEIINKKGQLVYLSDKVDRDIIQEFRNWVKE